MHELHRSATTDEFIYIVPELKHNHTVSVNQDEFSALQYANKNQHSPLKLTECTDTPTEAELQQLFDGLRNRISLHECGCVKGHILTIWDADAQAALVLQKDSKVAGYGYTRNNKLYLEYYETLFLLGKGRVQLKYNNLVVSLEQAYLLLLGEDTSHKFNDYLVYCCFSKLGCKLIKYQNLRYNGDAHTSGVKNLDSDAVETIQLNDEQLTRLCYKAKMAIECMRARILGHHSEFFGTGFIHSKTTSKSRKRKIYYDDTESADETEDHQSQSVSVKSSGAIHDMQLGDCAMDICDVDGDTDVDFKNSQQVVESKAGRWETSSFANPVHVEGEKTADDIQLVESGSEDSERSGNTNAFTSNINRAEEKIDNSNVEIFSAEVDPEDKTQGSMEEHDSDAKESDKTFSVIEAEMDALVRSEENIITICDDVADCSEIRENSKENADHKKIDCKMHRGSLVDFLTAESEYEEFKDVFGKIDIVKLETRTAHNESVKDLRISFDLYLHQQDYTRKQPAPPDFRLVVFGPNEPFPTHGEISKCYHRQIYPVPLLVIAVSDTKQLQVFFYYFR